MKLLPTGIILACYRRLPEWIVRNLVFFVIGGALGAGFVILSFRPVLLRIRSLSHKRWP